jgi:dATP pyrophosphohydrolase
MPKIDANMVDVYAFRRAGTQIEFLLVKRAPRIWLGGTWQAVHGKIEAGETAPQAALRELREETGLRPFGLWQLEFVNTFYVAQQDRILMCACFAAEIAGDAAIRLSDEHTEYRWEPYEQALKGFMWPGQRRALGEIVEEIVTPGAAEPHLRIQLNGADNVTE